MKKEYETPVVEVVEDNKMEGLFCSDELEKPIDYITSGVE